MRSFFETLPKRIAQIILTILTILTIDNISHNTLDTPKLSTDQIILCDIELTEKDLYDTRKSIENNKYPGNDGLTKDFFSIMMMFTTNKTTKSTCNSAPTTTYCAVGEKSKFEMLNSNNN